ncbi:MAG: hypothetical protein K6F08_01565 [bacterium]|nr:hypothetical protein [bacterium]
MNRVKPTKKTENYKIKIKLGSCLATDRCIYPYDEYGFDQGYICFKNTQNGEQAVFHREDPIDASFLKFQEKNILDKMREIRLTGQELNPYQPVPFKIYHYENKNADHYEYHLVKDYNTWGKVVKAYQLESVYCLTNKELVLNAKEIKQRYNEKLAYYTNYCYYHPSEDMCHLRYVSEQIVNDVDTILKAIGDDKINDILSNGYDEPAK